MAATTGMFCVGASSTTEIAAGSAFSSVEPAGVFPLAPNPRQATPYLDWTTVDKILRSLPDHNSNILIEHHG